MKTILYSLSACAISAALPLTALSQGADTKPGNCMIYAEMSAETVKKDSRFDDHPDIAVSLRKFAKAQKAKMDASMEETYAASKAFGWDKAKVDEMMKQNDVMMRKGFFTSTMDTSKLYMDHVQAVYGCASAQTDPKDLGQPIQAMQTTLQTMAKIVIS